MNAPLIASFSLRVDGNAAIERDETKHSTQRYQSIITNKHHQSNVRIGDRRRRRRWRHAEQPRRTILQLFGRSPSSMMMTMTMMTMTMVMRRRGQQLFEKTIRKSIVLTNGVSI
jgi:hypothetical protein